MFYVRGMLILVLIILLFTGSTVFAKQKVPSETALFQIDPVKHKIIALKDNIVPSLVLNYISVTTDQPLYWPDEEVFLKVICPVRPLQKIAITLQKKDATPRNVGSLSLNEAGILVEKILDGKEKRIEAGEYRVEVRSEDKTIESFTTFTVVEGALGAVSFAYDFQEVTSPEGLKTAKGAWFLGNAAGVGMRWGNGLNVKNEVRVFNEPYSGVATVKSRCYLPGCDGIEAGAPVETDIANGLLETVLDVGGHSGPFEIEVITGQGNVRYLFGRSGHVERQSIPVSSGVTNYFSATLAPYEGSVSVSGRGIYITKDPTRQDDPMELDSVVVGENRQVALQVQKTILHPRLYLLSPDPQGNFLAEEVKIPDVLEKGKEVILECSAPYVVMALGGFLEDENRMYEGWAMLFSETSLEVELAVPEEINPLQKSEVEITTTDRFSKKPVSVYGILEVFDNRVTSKSPKEPLISALGDSYRNLSNYLVSWQDRTGIGEKSKMESFVDEVKSLFMMESAPLPAAHGRVALAPMMDKGGAPEGMPEGIESSGSLAQETIREGEKKVVYCGVVQTDEKGKARVLVSFPPQTGRCNARFVAVAGFDYQEQIKTIDVQKKNYLETSIPALLMPGATLYPQVHVVNTGEENLQLKITGAGVKGPVLIPVEPGCR
ncbi:MAG: hypothetical protein NTX88_00825 [Candidatus Atribacteria bacterium]|nr:hypothetical protein [Candidatus Atribacteria bacterium]